MSIAEDRGNLRYSRRRSAGALRRFV